MKYFDFLKINDTFQYSINLQFDIGNINKIKEILNNMRPYLQMDGGDIEFIKYEDKYVYIKLSGACAHCGYQDLTIKDGIEEMLKSEIPEIEGVINVEL